MNKTRANKEAENRRKKEVHKRKRKDPFEHEKHKKECQDYRKKKKIEKQLLEDEIERLRSALEKKKKKIQELKKIVEELSNDSHIMNEQDPVQSQNEDVMEGNEDKEESQEDKEKCEEVVKKMIEDEKILERMTRHTFQMFHELVDEVRECFENTTWRATIRIDQTTKNTYKPEIAVFLLLFWMHHYPTMELMSIIFHAHPRTLTRIIKRTSFALSMTLQNEIKKPTDDECANLVNTSFHNIPFMDAICVIDGTEIRISRPSDPVIQTSTWSAKKKQNSLNVMFMTKLNGEITYFSPLRVGAHDQAHWNELGLRETFLGKAYAVIGDGGFTFNRQSDNQQIRGYTPHKRPQGGSLTPEQKDYNKKLAQMRVVVENTIRRVKVWRIFRGTYRHWRNGTGQINGNEILTIAAVLSNREIHRSPPRKADWVAPDRRK